MIGIFDSGIGGLTVVKEVFRLLPQYQILYFGDSARTPYGNKSAETVIKYAIQDTEFLLSKGAQIIIVACNTASAVASEELKKKFKVPIFEVITPAVNKAIAVTKNQKIGVIGTTATIRSGIYEKLIKERKNHWEIFSKDCPLLVPLVEENWLKRPETKMIVKKYVRPLKLKNIDTLILGCTHYPLLRDLIAVKMGKRVTLVDPAGETVLELKRFLEKNLEIDESLPKDQNHQFFLSDLTPKFKDIATNWLGRKIKLELANFE